MVSEPISFSPPDLSTIRIEIDGDIGTMTLDRPDALNAMDAVLIQEFTDAAGWLADRAPLRALIVTGAGDRAFSAGGDVNSFKQGVEDPDIDLASSVRRGAEILHQGIVDFQRIPFPVIAAVNGAAAGAGFSLALACDLRIMSEQSFLVVAYGRIGASPDGGMTYFLPRVVGPAKAKELMLEDPTISPADALELGLASKVVPADQLMEVAREKAEELAAKAPHYVRMAKLLANTSLDHTLTEHLQIERHGIADSMATEDLREGVTAFFGGDQPEFKGG